MKRLTCTTCNLQFFTHDCPINNSRFKSGSWLRRDLDRVCPSCDPFLTVKEQAKVVSQPTCTTCPSYKKCLTIDMREQPSIKLAASQQQLHCEGVMLKPPSQYDCSFKTNLIKYNATI